MGIFWHHISLLFFKRNEFYSTATDVLVSHCPWIQEYLLPFKRSFNTTYLTSLTDDLSLVLPVTHAATMLLAAALPSSSDSSSGGKSIVASCYGTKSYFYYRYSKWHQAVFAQWLKRPLISWEVVGSNPSPIIPKIPIALLSGSRPLCQCSIHCTQQTRECIEMEIGATLCYAQHRKTFFWILFSSASMAFWAGEKFNPLNIIKIF